MIRAAGLTAAFYGAMFFALGVHLPFWPVWLESWGLTPTQVSSYAGAAIIARVAAGAILPVIADRFAARRLLLALSCAGSALLFGLHPLIGDDWTLFGATILAAALSAPLLPLGEALGLRAALMHGFGYARVRAAGSCAFLIANLLLGVWIAEIGPGVIVWALVIPLLLAAVIAPVHPGGGAPPGAMADQARPGEALGLMTHPVFLMFTLAAAIGQASHAVYYVYSALDWERQGIAPETIGALWAAGVAVEIALMLGPGRWLVARLGPAAALGIGAAAGILRWGVMAFEPPLWSLWPLQGLHALTFAMAHLGAMAFIARAIPQRMAASAQGLFAGGIGGLAMAGATFLAGWVAGEHGPLAPAYGVAMAMSALANRSVLNCHLRSR